MKRILHALVGAALLLLTPASHANTSLAPSGGSHADWLSQAQTLEQRQDWQALLDLGMAWSDLDHLSAMAWYVQGRAHTELQNAAGAIGAYLQTLSLNPTDINALNNLGNAYRTIGRYQDALRSYREAIHIDPGYSRAWHNLGVTYYSLRGYEGIQEALAEAEAINPAMATAWRDLMTEYSRHGDQIQALSTIRTLAQQDRSSLDKLFDLLLSRVDTP